MCNYTSGRRSLQRLNGMVAYGLKVASLYVVSYDADSLQRSKSGISLTPHTTTVYNPADQCLPVIQQNVWFPNKMVRKSHIGHTRIIQWIPLEVIVSPVLQNANTFGTLPFTFHLLIFNTFKVLLAY